MFTTSKISYATILHPRWYRLIARVNHECIYLCVCVWRMQYLIIVYRILLQIMDMFQFTIKTFSLILMVQRRCDMEISRKFPRNFIISYPLIQENTDRPRTPAIPSSLFHSFTYSANICTKSMPGTVKVNENNYTAKIDKTPTFQVLMVSSKGTSLK